MDRYDVDRNFIAALENYGLKPNHGDIPIKKIVKCGTATKPRSKNGRYCLMGYDGNPTGWYMDMARDQKPIQWSYYNKNDIRRVHFTPLDKKEWEKKAENEKAKAEADYNLAAKGATAIWDYAGEHGEPLTKITTSDGYEEVEELHDYVVRKGITSQNAHGITGRILNDIWTATTGQSKQPYDDTALELLIPLRNSEGIQTLQRIRANNYPGTETNKMLLRGARKYGCYALIKKSDNPKYIIIAEGWATAETIADYTDKDTAVYMGIDKGNLLPAALEIAKTVGDGPTYIFAADNDAKPDGSNPGLEAATNAAKSMSGAILIPPKAGDWNDMMLSHEESIYKVFKDNNLEQEIQKQGAKPYTAKLPVESSIETPGGTPPDPQTPEKKPMKKSAKQVANEALIMPDDMSTPLLPHNLSALNQRWMAKVYAHLFGDRVRFLNTHKINDLDGWVVYGDLCADKRQYWHKNAKSAALNLMADAVPAAIREAYDALNLDPTYDADKISKIESFLRKSQDTPYVKNALESAAALCMVSEDAFDANEWLLCTPSGTVDLSGEKILVRPNSKDDMLTIQIDTPYDPNAWSPTWQRFISDIMCNRADMMEYLQRVIGYCIFGYNRESVFFLFRGDGSNGKSLLTEVINDVIGDYSIFSSVETLTQKNVQGGGSGPSENLARLKGKRLVIISEFDSLKFDTRRIKSIILDKITARRNYGSEFDFLPQFKVVITSNDLPNIYDQSDGFWRKLLVIPFDAKFTPETEDQNLKYKLLAEAPAILKWAIDGAMARKHQGLKTHKPDAVSTAICTYRASQDKIGTFLEDRFDVDGKSFTSFWNVYETFKFWCDNNGERPMSRRRLAMELIKRKVIPAKKKNERGYLMRLLDSDERMDGIPATEFVDLDAQKPPEPKPEPEDPQTKLNF